jgi:hypothetical protein
MFINRGNHEAKEMNRTYGFEGEAKHKHGDQSYKVYLTSIMLIRPLIDCSSSSLRMFLLHVSLIYYLL